MATDWTRHLEEERVARRREAARIRACKRRQNRIAAGLCISCSKPNKTKLPVCQKCRDIRVEKDRQKKGYYERHKCYRCGAPSAVGAGWGKYKCAKCAANDDIKRAVPKAGRVVVYRILFKDGAAYIGVTSRSLRERIKEHRKKPNNAELGRRLREREFYEVSILSTHSTRAAAEAAETRFIFVEKKPINRGEFADDWRYNERCVRCRQIKPLSDFGRDFKQRNGHSIYCKVCIVGVRQRAKLLRARMAAKVAAAA